MALITTAILKRLQALIGYSSTGLGPVEVDTANISLTLPIVPQIARRGLAPGAIGGWGFGVMENVHAGADFESSNMDPYQAGTAAVGAYPPVVPPEFDVWVLAVSAVRSSGSGGLDDATLVMNPVASQQMWGIDDQGAPLVADPVMVLARFDALQSSPTGGPDFMITEAGDPFVKIGVRLPRSGLNLAFHSEAAAAAEFQMSVLMGLFPAALGQDVVAF